MYFHHRSLDFVLKTNFFQHHCQIDQPTDWQKSRFEEYSTFLIDGDKKSKLYQQFYFNYQLRQINLGSIAQDLFINYLSINYMQIQKNDFYSDHGYLCSQDRRQILSKQSIQKYPYNCIGLIVFQNKFGQKKIATGFLISPDFILTSAHSIWSRLETGELIHYQPASIQFYPALLGTAFNQEAYPINDYRFPQQYLIELQKINENEFFQGTFEKKNQLSYQSQAYDYMLMRLERPVKRYKYLQMVYNFEGGAQISCFGYPKDLSYVEIGKQEQNRVYQQGGHSGELKQLKQGRIYHQLDTSYGQSGSPILAEIDGEVCVIGIHKAQIKKQLNLAISLTKSMISNILAWQGEMSLSKFQIRTFQNGRKLNCDCYSLKKNAVSDHLEALKVKIVQQYKQKKQKTKKVAINEESTMKRVEQSSQPFLRFPNIFKLFSPPHSTVKFKWDVNTPHANKFRITQKHVERVCRPELNEYLFQLVSQEPFQYNGVHRIVISIKNYGDHKRSTIGMGILTQSRKYKDFSGQQLESCAYWTCSFPQPPQGSITLNGKRSVQWISSLFTPQGNWIGLELDASNKALYIFGSKSRYNLVLGEDWKDKKIYFFIVMQNKGDLIEIL